MGQAVMAATQLENLEICSATLGQTLDSCELSTSQQHPLGPPIIAESLCLCQPAQQEVTQHLAPPVSQPDSCVIIYSLICQRLLL